ncbi:DUF2628 domain-containing protein [Terrihabitans rhizophilus]|uniref:DUF2628 domain-containing protein n=1 Tax=Terrihabitans rhizophilus TaxID=3092662 RepID=A0ABU4RV38_9HYPH|nr:DUF2628 domain-containing protein [Terrihabitans sp. PJ23]MDX6807520.1 DUF2628 domain-containing protein [Terrihabitans sp. PJ23]
MRIWTVHEPASATTAIERAEKLVLIKDGFSWLAFFFSPLWMLYHRLWLGTLLYVLISAATIAAGLLLPLGSGSEFLLGFVPMLYAGFEGNDLRRRKLERRGYTQIGAVAARSGMEAEVAYFASAPEVASETRPAVPALLKPLVQRPVPDHGVLGLFPMPEVRR